eukprot:TRINITY_DN300_c0_g1_i5.p1 TRINITY_DN300_c0_g1~~TRINITY_DN300_c0_g1_i5.p1  ORF type:complete len:198 (-),score=52.26 TRINITY_DN300_c0_g1_i5:69-662(-)
MLKLAVTLALCVAAVVAQTPPSKPVWPNAFSATVFMQSVNTTIPPRFMRWFYDKTNERERFDGLDFWRGEQLFTTVIRTGGAQGMEYQIIYHQDETICFSQANKNPILKPDFNMFNYVGYTLIDYTVTNHWVATNRTTNWVFNYYESQKSREPVEYDILDQHRNEVTYHFYEFDAGAQDSSLFTVAPLIRAVCNPRA